MKFNKNIYNDWFEQAKQTLDSANRDIQGGDYNWACFKAQQSTEFSLKAILHGLGLNAYGHSVKELAEILSTSIKSLSIDINCLVLLDKLYIPTRYPDAFPSGSPFKYYTNTDAQKAIDCSEKILEQIQKYVKSL